MNLGAAPAVSQAPAAPALQLAVQPVVDAQTFQARWQQLPVAHSGELSLRAPFPAAAQQIESLCARGNILTLASGTIGQAMKFYLFAKDVRARRCCSRRRRPRSPRSTPALCGAAC